MSFPLLSAKKAYSKVLNPHKVSTEWRLAVPNTLQKKSSSFNTTKSIILYYYLPIRSTLLSAHWKPKYKLPEYEL